jgi:protein-S-isoprenylcysteine O-methyltransferase Ste14
MEVALLIAAVFSAVASVPLLARVRREYRSDVELSQTTVWAVWIFYGLLVALLVVAAVAGTWELGLPFALSLALGIPLLALGAAIDLAGVISMGSLARMNGTQPDRLITEGAFRYSRNPQNLGIGLAGIGTAALGDSSLSLLLGVAGIVVFRIYVGFEEEHLERTFGEEYADYKRRTPRFAGIPAR